MDVFDYTLTSDGRLALRKHVHRILAPTCQETESLRVLRISNCVNLIEMNFIVENNASVENEPWVESLLDLLTVNPHLSAISLENLRLHDASTEEQVSKLLDLLDQNPVITSVYICTDSHIRDESGVEKMTAIQIRLLARVPTDSVRPLYVRTAIPRSGRGRPTSSGRPWPVRESPAYAKMNGSELNREVKRNGGHGRWVSEQKFLGEPRYAVAVLAQNDGSVELKTIPTVKYQSATRSEKVPIGLAKFWRPIASMRRHPWNKGLHK